VRTTTLVFSSKDGAFRQLTWRRHAMQCANVDGVLCVLEDGWEVGSVVELIVCAFLKAEE
jgi:hypothetical protein